MDHAMMPAPTPAQDEQIAYSVEEAAAKLGIGRSLLWELIASGDGPPVLRLGRRVLLPAAQLRAWAEQRTTAGGR